jgi:hypothetical protein
MGGHCFESQEENLLSIRLQVLSETSLYSEDAIQHPKGCKPTKSYVDIAVQGNAHNPDNEFIMKDLFKHPEALFESR